MLTVVHITTGLGLGGAERTLFQVCDGLREYRHHVVSLTGRGNWGQRFEDNGNEVVSLNITSVGSLISGFFRLRSFLRVAKPDLVQTWMPHANLIGGLAARSVGIRRVFWNMRASGYGPLFRNFSTWSVVLISAVMSRWIPRKIIACGDAVATNHVSMGYPAGRMVTIKNGYEPEVRDEELSVESLRPKIFPTGSNQITVGMVARYDDQKDHGTFLRALSLLENHHKNLRVLLVGNGCDHNNTALAKQIKALGLSHLVELKGLIENPVEIIGLMDFHVLSSAYGEGFPNAVAETMVAGVPNIATNVGDAAEIIGDSGWVVPPRSPELLAGAIAEALSMDSRQYVVLSRKSRQRIEECFSRSTTLERYNYVYQSYRCLALTRYSNNAPSSRVRFFQYYDALFQNGFEIESQPLLSASFIHNKFSGTWQWYKVPFLYIRRALVLLKRHNFDILWLEKELFPNFPFWLERLFLRKSEALVVDFDDAIFHQYSQSHSFLVRHLLGAKISRIIDRASTVTVGNSYLHNYAQLHSKKGALTIIPSVYAMPPVVPSSATETLPSGKPVVGWLGTPITWAAYGRPWAERLHGFLSEQGARLRIVGSGEPDGEREGIDYVSWTFESEASLVAGFDIGVMPINDDPWSRGKCGYKLIVYLAHGKPVIASPVGANIDILGNNNVGFLAKNPDEWTEKLSILLKNDALRAEMGANALALTQSKYSWADALDTLAQSLKFSVEINKNSRQKSDS